MTYVESTLKSPPHIFIPSVQLTSFVLELVLEDKLRMIGCGFESTICFVAVKKNCCFSSTTISANRVLRFTIFESIYKLVRFSDRFPDNWKRAFNKTRLAYNLKWSEPIRVYRIDEFYFFLDDWKLPELTKHGGVDVPIEDYLQ